MAKKKVTKAEKPRWVVVTTDKDRRGVFFGELVSHKGSIVELRNAQIAVYWSAETRGVAGLASMGPQIGSRISPPIPQIKLNGVTAVMDTTKEAVQLWQSQPWG